MPESSPFQSIGSRLFAGQGVAEAVAEVEVGGVAAATAKIAIGLGGQSCLLDGHRLDDDVRFLRSRHPGLALMTESRRLSRTIAVSRYEAADMRRLPAASMQSDKSKPVRLALDHSHHCR